MNHIKDEATKWVAEQLVKLAEPRMVARENGSQYHKFRYETPKESVDRAVETLKLIMKRIEKVEL